MAEIKVRVCDVRTSIMDQAQRCGKPAEGRCVFCGEDVCADHTLAGVRIYVQERHPGLPTAAGTRAPVFVDKHVCALSVCPACQPKRVTFPLLNDVFAQLAQAVPPIVDSIVTARKLTGGDSK